MRKQDVEVIRLLQCISGMKERRKEGGEEGKQEGRKRRKGRKEEVFKNREI